MAGGAGSAQRELVSQVLPAQQGPPGARLSVDAAGATPTRRPTLDQVPDAARGSPSTRAATSVLVGGPTAQEYDLRQSATRDNRVIIPLTLVVVFLILAVLLRALLAPLLLVLSVILSLRRRARRRRVRLRRDLRLPRRRPVAAAAVLRLPRRAGDRLQHLPDGARARGGASSTARARARCAASRSPARSSPAPASCSPARSARSPCCRWSFLTEIGFIVAFGVLLDTFIVRSVIVPGARDRPRPPRVVAVAAAARRGAGERRGLRVDGRAGCDCPTAPLQQDEMRGGPVRLACLSALLGLLLCVPGPGEAAAADHQRPPGRRRRVPRAGRALPDPVRLHLRRHADQQPLLPDRRALRDRREHGRGPPGEPVQRPARQHRPRRRPAVHSSPRWTATAPTTRTRSTTTPRCSRSPRRRRPRTSRSAW